MTYRRLIQELEPGEVVYELAYDELEVDRRAKARERAERAAAALRGRR